jgi:hypothetical protein
VNRVGFEICITKFTSLKMMRHQRQVSSTEARWTTVRTWQVMVVGAAFTTIYLLVLRSFDKQKISQLRVELAELVAVPAYSGPVSDNATFWGSENSSVKYCQKMEVCDIYADRATCLCNGQKVTFDESGVVVDQGAGSAGGQ